MPSSPSRDRRRLAPRWAPAVGVLPSGLSRDTLREMIVGDRRDQGRDGTSNTRVRQVRAADVA